MKKILTFKLFEAQYSSHFQKRFEERIMNLTQISLDSVNAEVTEKKIESEIGPNWRQLLIESIIKNTERRILYKVKLTSFDPEKNIAVPISFLNLEFDGKTYPIQISSYSSKETDGEQSLYKGSQIWVAVSGDTAWTLKVFDKTKDLDSISSNMKEGTSERYRGYPFEIQRPGEDFKVKFSWNPEARIFQSNDEEEKIEAPILNKPIPERKTLSVGDIVGLILKRVSAEEVTYGKIQEITNMSEIKDKQKIGSLSDVDGIKLKFLPLDQSHWVKNSEGKIVPYQSTLKGGSKIGIDGIEYIVLGPEGGKPLVTSEPSIINSGRVQTWVERIITFSS